MDVYRRQADHWGSAAVKARIEAAAAMRARAEATRRALGPASRRRTVVRLFLPLTAIAVLLAPFAFLLALVCTPFWPVFRVNPFTAALAIGRLLFSLGGSDVRVDTPGALVRVRIF